MKLFSADTYRQRRLDLISRIEHGLIWILGNEESPKNYRDNTYSFRQDSHFLYYAGIPLPGLGLLMDADSGQCMLYGDDASMDDIVWTGPTQSLQELATLAGIEEIISTKRAVQLLIDAKTKRTIHFTPPYRGDNQIRIAETLGCRSKEVMQNTSLELIEAIILQRSVKEAQELQEIEHALSITRLMHLEVMYEARPDLFESDMMAELMKVAHRHRVDTAYPVILTVNGQTLHNHHHHNRMSEGQLLLGDFGAESSMFYASDITRTIPVSKHFTSQQENIYQLVLEMLSTATKSLAPGLAYQKIHLMSSEVLAEGMVQMGLMRGDPAEIVAAGAHALFFPHGLGHMLGLDVHDMEDLGEDLVGYDQETKRSKQFGTSSLRLGKKLQTGFVLTVEPGIYFIPELIDQWQAKGLHVDFINYHEVEKYRDFGGIRIEDNYAITDTSAKLLGESIPKTVEEISFLRSIDKYTGESALD